MGDETDMTGFYTSPWSMPTSEAFPLSTDIDVPAIVESAAADSNASNYFSGWSLPSSEAITTGIKNTVDYGLSIGNSLLTGYGKLQDMELNRYLKTAQVDILQTQAAGAVDVAKLKATAQNNLAKVYSNSTGSAASLASMGQTPSSLMLYLTILGVVFAGIQIINSGR